MRLIAEMPRVYYAKMQQHIQIGIFALAGFHESEFRTSFEARRYLIGSARLTTWRPLQCSLLQRTQHGSPTKHW